MRIVDAQVHIWGANTPERPWPPAQLEPHSPAPFSKDDLLREMNAAGVNCAVIVPPMWEGDRNDLALEAARLHPERFAVMGRIDMMAPASRGLMATWRRHGMLGLRLAFKRPPFRTTLAEGRADCILTFAAFTMHLARSACSGALTSRISRAPTARPSLCLPKRCRG